MFATDRRKMGDLVVPRALVAIAVFIAALNVMLLLDFLATSM